MGRGLTALLPENVRNHAYVNIYRVDYTYTIHGLLSSRSPDVGCRSITGQPVCQIRGVLAPKDTPIFLQHPWLPFLITPLT